MIDWITYNLIPYPCKALRTHIHAHPPLYTARLRKKPFFTVRLLAYCGNGGIEVINWFGLIRFKYYKQIK